MSNMFLQCDGYDDCREEYKRVVDELMNSPQKRKELLTRVGMYNQDGSISEKYRHLFEE